MNKWFTRLAVIVICLWSNSACFAYKITGTLKNLGCFYPKVYLAVINNIDGIYGTCDQDIISSADVDSNGNFLLSGNDLPDEPRFYRLYLTGDKKIKASIICGSGRNYILLAMNNKTEVAIYCDNFCKPFFTHTIQGSPENEAMLFVQNLLMQSDSLLWDSAAGTSKKQFLVSKRYAGLRQFADTSRSLLAAMWAITEMHIDTNYYHDQLFFDSFAARFRKSAHSPDYSRQLDERLDILRYKKEGKQPHPPGIAFLIVCALLGVSVVLNVYLVFNKKRKAATEYKEPALEVPAPGNNEENIKGVIEKLTIKEREILKMVDEGLSNKEIAGKLFVEVSTVKSHISNIYQKTAIKNRKEVAGIARYL
jgi:DNA-binding CsgD family transcriptional regulator